VDSLEGRNLADIDPNLTIIDLHSLDQQVADKFTQALRLTTLFGLLALVLGAGGLHGITSYAVARLMAGQLYGARTWHPFSLGIAIGLLAVAAALSGFFLPARRAASVEPMQARRIE
jgi:ABC-type antimicrobial peptide transport system permease subunit